MKRFNLKLPILLMGLLVIGSLTHARQTDLAKVEAINRLMAEYAGKPGAAVAVFQNGEVIFQQGYGLANLDYNIPVTTKTVFDTGLASTTFTAALIVLLENQGKLDFDDTIQKYIPEFPRYPEGDITIRQLLLHTSGLRDYIRIFFAKREAWNRNFDEDKALYLMMQQNGLAFAPGTRFQPGDSNYSLLASIVRRITGMSIGEYAKKELFGPLGMSSSFIYENLGMTIPNRAIGYEDEGEGYQLNHFFAFTGGGNRRVYSTVEDYFPWSENLKENKVGNGTFLDKMFTRGTLSDGSRLTSAFGLEHGNFMGQPLVGYGGHWAGNASMYLKFPEVDLSVVVLSNNGTISASGKAYDLAAIFLEDYQQEEASEASPGTSAPTDKIIDLPADKLQAFVGDYFNYQSGYVRKILVQDGKLIYNRLDAGESRLSPISDTEFIMDNTPYRVEISFKPNDEGKPGMFIQIEDDPVIEYMKTTTPTYTAQELAAFEGDYYCSDLDVTYTIKAVDGQLESSIGTEPFLTWSPVMTNLFNEAHFGYLLFEKGRRNSYKAFTMNNALGTLRFVKQ